MLLPCFAFVGADVVPAVVLASNGPASPTTHMFRCKKTLALAESVGAPVPVQVDSRAGEHIGFLMFLVRFHLCCAANYHCMVTVA